LDDLEKDQIDFCKEIIARCGGFILGVFMNNIATCFGYSELDDMYTRRAAITVLELFTEVKKRNTLLLEQYGVGLMIQMGLHTETVLVQKNRLPKGNAVNIAFDLALCADFGSVLVSTTSKKVLEPFLKFGRVENIDVFNKTEVMEVYRLIGKRQKEVLPSLPSWSSNQKIIDRKEEEVIELQPWPLIDKGRKSMIINSQVGIRISKLINKVKSVFHARKLTRMELSS
jgi:hypothetical protein